MSYRRMRYKNHATLLAVLHHIAPGSGFNQNSHRNFLPCAHPVLAWHAGPAKCPKKPQEITDSRAGLQARVLDNTAAFFAAPGKQEAMYFFGPSSLPQNCVRMLSWCTKSKETCGAWHAWRVKRLNANTCRSVWRNECMGHVGGTSACAYRREPANLTPSSQAVSFRLLLVVTLRPVLV